MHLSHRAVDNSVQIISDKFSFPIAINVVLDCRNTYFINPLCKCAFECGRGHFGIMAMENDFFMKQFLSVACLNDIATHLMVCE